MIARALIDQFDFKGDDHILDIGSGDGRLTAELATRVPKGKVVGIDPSDSMHRFATGKYQKDNLSFRKGKATDIPFDEKFTTITSFSTLHWEVDQTSALLTFKNTLRPKGAIVLAIPGFDMVLQESLHELTNEERWYPYLNAYESGAYFWNREEYASFLQAAGFTIQKLDLIERPFYFSDETKYRAFLCTILPNFLLLPAEEHPTYLSQLIDKIKAKNYVTRKGEFPFNVEVIEVIAKAP